MTNEQNKDPVDELDAIAEEVAEAVNEEIEAADQEVEQQEAQMEDELPDMSDRELRALALDAVEGRLYGTWMCANSDEMRASFPILGLVDQEWFEGMKARNVVHFYEKMDKAAPIGVNGKPMFFSAHALTQSNFERLASLINMLLEQRRQFLGEDA